MRSTLFFHSKGFIFAVDRVQMFLKHGETCIAQKLNCLFAEWTDVRHGTTGTF